MSTIDNQLQTLKRDLDKEQRKKGELEREEKRIIQLLAKEDRTLKELEQAAEKARRDLDQAEQKLSVHRQLMDKISNDKQRVTTEKSQHETRLMQIEGQVTSLSQQLQAELNNKKAV